MFGREVGIKNNCCVYAKNQNSISIHTQLLRMIQKHSTTLLGYKLSKVSDNKLSGFITGIIKFSKAVP